MLRVYHLTILQVRHIVLSDCRKLKFNEVCVISNDNIFISNFVKILYFFKNLRGGHKGGQ
jgi:hypothetical protein